LAFRRVGWEAVKVAPPEELLARYALLAQVGHDFNNVLSVSQSVAEGLDAAGDLPPTLRPEVDALVASVEAATSWTHRLSRLRVARASLGQDRIDLATALASAAMTPAAAALRTTSAGPAGLAVRASATLVERVLGEALQNARDAKAHHVRLEAAADGNRACVTVADDGEGMSVATLSQAFDPLFTTRGKARGKGLGLCIIHASMTTIGGEVELESAPQKGATLRLWFPIEP
jgi:C4-dicarboxylate-specific signal transduction histidine kinase